MGAAEDGLESFRMSIGLEVPCQLDDNDYTKGRGISDADMANSNTTRNAFHGNWNYDPYLVRSLTSDSVSTDGSYVATDSTIPARRRRLYEYLSLSIID